MISKILIIFIMNHSFSQNRTNLFKKDSVTVERVPVKNNPDKPTASKVSNSKPVIYGNLPNDYRSNYSVTIEESPIVLPTNRNGVRFRELKAGDLTNATIKESVFAFQDSKAPVRAIITTGPLRGAVFIGEASLEKNSKRIIIEFKKFRDPQGRDTYSVIASAMDYKGVLGVNGSVVSNEESYFAAEFLAAGAAGYADSMISREQNAYGNTVESKSSDTLTKKALVAGLTKTAERFSEKLKQVPEYSVLEGPIQIQILILEQPTLTP